jgi:hypothetical protein
MNSNYDKIQLYKDFEYVCINISVGSKIAAGIDALGPTAARSLEQRFTYTRLWPDDVPDAEF